MSLHMTAKEVDIYGMYLVVNCNETKYSYLYVIQIMTKKYSNFILKMLTVTFPICQLNDD
jgi:hypothetical protein